MQLSYSDVQALAAKYAPLIYLHKDERYLPCEVDWYLSQSSIRDSKGNVLYDPASTDALVAPNVDASCYVHPHSDSLPKPPSGAPVYVRFTPVSGQSGVYDMEYWFFYWYNGPSTAEVTGSLGSHEKGFHFGIPPAGEHEGDWEHMTVRLDESANVVAVFYAEHSGGKWLKSGAYPTDPASGRPVGYSAINSHATYHTASTSVIAQTPPISPVISAGLALIDRTAKDTAWDTSANVNIISVDASICGNAPPAANWTAFAGEWGQPTDQKKLVKDVKGALEKVFTSIVADAVWPELEKLLEKYPEPGGPVGPNPTKKGWNGEPTNP